MIRGAIIGRYMRQHNLSELDLTSQEVKGLFFDANSTRYLNAYLLSQEKNRNGTLPLPLCWFKDKDVELKENSPIAVMILVLIEETIQKLQRLWVNTSGQKRGNDKFIQRKAAD